LNSATELLDGGAVMYETGWDATWNNTTYVDPTNVNLGLNLVCAPGTYPVFPATWTASAANNENLPINCVTWYEAYAFCIWDGGFLPSEAEWEYAAAGGNLQREYPWGTAAPGTACPGTGCEYAIYNCDYPTGSGNCTGVANIAPVGYASRGAGYWGQFDLAGEVWEWNLDWYAPYVDSCIDCAYLPTTALSRVLRGGYFDVDLGGAAYLLSSNRLGTGGWYRNGSVGFRCARTP
jgi:formylglycine-generating enzyme required for sulfatase activity